MQSKIHEDVLKLANSSIDELGKVIKSVDGVFKSMINDEKIENRNQLLGVSAKLNKVLKYAKDGDLSKLQNLADQIKEQNAGKNTKS